MTSVKLEKSNARPMEQLKYASYIGTEYMSCIAVCKLSKFTINPSVAHWKTIERVPKN